MDDRLLGAFREATMATFRDMFGLPASGGPPREIAANDEHGWDITGLVGLAGQVHGVVAIRLTAALAAALLAKSGVEVPGDEGGRAAMLGGLVGEMTNIIAGSASSTAPGVEFEIAPPVVVRGPGHKINWPAIGPVISVPFSTASGSFELSLCAKA